MPITIELNALEELTAKLYEIVGKVETIETKLSEPKFYTIKEVAKMTGWSIPTVQSLFNRRDFPSCDFGSSKVVESTALRAYFSKPQRK